MFLQGVEPNPNFLSEPYIIDIFEFSLNIFTEFSNKTFEERTLQPAISCLRDYDVSTQLARHL